MATTTTRKGPAKLRETQPGFTGRIPEHLLLVDPDPVFSKLLRTWLEQRGWRVSHFSSGRKALAAAAETPVQVALTCLETDDIDGFSVIDQLGRFVPGLPIVVCAPHAGVKAWDPSILVSLGATAALARPIRFQRLEETLLGVVAASRKRKAGREKSSYRFDPMT
jgi:two-component system OmpR family response regulator